MHVHQRSILLFSVGLVMAVGLWVIPVTRAWLEALSQIGYVAPFVAGLLYGSTLTSSIATALFFNLSMMSDPLISAIIGGFGAMAYDVVVFTALERIEPRGIFHRFHDWIVHRRVTRLGAIATGLIVISSPLPDELGVALLGTTNISRWRFLLLAFLLNTLGILVIILTGRGY